MAGAKKSAVGGPLALPIQEGLATSATLSIRVVSRLTGVEPHTLRMWERRYGFPKPARCSGGDRLYVKSDVEALLLIRRALINGYRPGEIVHKSLADLELLVGAAPPAPTSGAFPSVGEALHALTSDDLTSLQSQLKRAAFLLGPKRFVTEFAQPASVRVGELWADGKMEVRHEHVFTECLSSQLNLLLSAFDDVAHGLSVLLAALPGEVHGLGMEMIAVVLAASHVTPRLLGVDTPPQQIVAAAAAYRCDAVGIAITRPADLKQIELQLRWMLAELPRRVPIWAGGPGASGLDVEGVVIVRDWAELDASIQRLGR